MSRYGGPALRIVIDFTAGLRIPEEVSKVSQVNVYSEERVCKLPLHVLLFF